ncbi:Aquaporin-1 [Savitreella phatthalungensis]
MSTSGSLRRTMRDSEPSHDKYHSRRRSDMSNNDLVEDFKSRHPVPPASAGTGASSTTAAPPINARSPASPNSFAQDRLSGSTETNIDHEASVGLPMTASRVEGQQTSGHFFNDGENDFVASLGQPNKNNRVDMQDGPNSYHGTQAARVRSHSRFRERVQEYNPIHVHLSDLTGSQRRALRIKNHILAMIGEFVGTTLFLMFAYLGTQVASIPNTSINGNTTTTGSQESGQAVQTQVSNTSSLQFIALSFGFSLAVNAWVFFRISGGLFNPAVAFGLALVGVITPVRAVLLTISEILGGMTAAAIVQALLPGPQYVTTRLADNMSVTRGLFLEMFLTAMLMLTIFLLAAEKSRATFLAPIGIGLALFIAELGGVYWTGGSLNPARTLGPDVVGKQFPGYTWIYYAGPLLGSLVAAGFYKMMRVLHYETVVPGQDADGTSPLMADGDKAPTDEPRGRSGGDAFEPSHAEKAAMAADPNATMQTSGGPSMAEAGRDKSEKYEEAMNAGGSAAPSAARPSVGRGASRGVSFLGIPLGARQQSYAVDRIAGPGIADYSRPSAGGLGADLDNITEATKYAPRTR